MEKEEISKEQREEILNEISGRSFITKKVVKVGINQGQFFVRIPKKIGDLVKIDKDSRIEFKLTKWKSRSKLELRVL